MSASTRLRGVVLLGLAGLFVALYLWLYHMGFYGALVCGPGSCETVQASKYAYFLGQPVPLWGTVWYAAVIGLAFLALGSPSRGRVPHALLAAASVGGLGFSVYLTAIELFVIHAICMWCVVSAVLTVAIFVLVAPWRPGALGGSRVG